MQSDEEERRGGRLHRHAHDHEPSDDSEPAEEIEPERWPGRRTLLDPVIDRRAASVGKRSLTAEMARRVDAARRRSGRALPEASRSRLEVAFAADLGGVRVHTGPEADAAARALDAEAFTIGRDVFFAQGRFAPDTDGGLRLLAHEVAHTLQPETARTPGISDPGDAHEVAAERAADAAMTGRAPTPEVPSGPGATISRSPAGSAQRSDGDTVVVMDPEANGAVARVPLAEVEARYIDNHIVNVTFYESPLITSGDPKMKALEWFIVHYAHGGALTFRLGAGGIPIPAKRTSSTAGMRVGSARVVVEAELRPGRIERTFIHRGGYYWPSDLNEHTVPELTIIATSIRQRHILLAEMFLYQEAAGHRR